jgi:hypothetical protein
MNWTKISAISDVVVAISVIVSLVYVANQLDQNTKALQLSGVISTTEMWTEQQILLAENGELNAIFWKGMSGDGSLSESEQRRYEAFMSGWVQAFQQSYHMQMAGGLNSGIWQNQLHSIKWVFSNPGAIDYWRKWGGNHDPSFSAFLETIITSNSPDR